MTIICDSRIYFFQKLAANSLGKNAFGALVLRKSLDKWVSEDFQFCSSSLDLL